MEILESIRAQVDTSCPGVRVMYGVRRYRLSARLGYILELRIACMPMYNAS